MGNWRDWKVPVRTQEPLRTYEDQTERILGATKLQTVLIHENITGNFTRQLIPPIGHYYKIRSVNLVLYGGGILTPQTTYGFYHGRTGTLWTVHEMAIIGDGADKGMEISISPYSSTWNEYLDPIRRVQLSIPDLQLTDELRFQVVAGGGGTHQYRILYDDYEAI